MILYKYCTARGFDCLDSGRIWLTRPRAFNDPFDVLPHIERTGQQIQSGDGVLVNTSDIVVLCLAENVDNPLMWAHYAASHSGLLIGFRGEGRIIEDGLIFRKFNAVSYSHYRPSGRTFEELSDDEIYFRKSSEWAYEREWRLVTSTLVDTATKVDEDHWSYPIITTDVVSVVVGYRGEGLLPRLREVLKRPQYDHIQLQVAKPDEKTFRLNLDDCPPEE